VPGIIEAVLGDERVPSFAAADSNGDGVVDKEEWRRAMVHQV